MVFHSAPVGLPGLAALATGALAFALALLAARRGRVTGDAAARRLSGSTFGIAIQSAGFAVAGIGPVAVTLDPLAAAALSEAIAVAALMAAAVVLFVTATRAMGSNWSIRARTRADHRLVEDGPFRFVRNPIYLAMALFLFALAIALGHASQLAIALPVFALGTALRVSSEEALLTSAFGEAYVAYAARVKRFLPGVF